MYIISWEIFYSQLKQCNYFAPYLKYGSKIFLSNALFLTFFNPMFANCDHTKTMFVHVSEREIFFSLNCSKFAEECDWNSKNSQKVQNLGCFWKNTCFFSKTLKFLKIATCGNFFLDCVSISIFSWKYLSILFLRLLWQKSETI